MKYQDIYKQTIELSNMLKNNEALKNKKPSSCLSSLELIPEHAEEQELETQSFDEECLEIDNARRARESRW